MPSAAETAVGTRADGPRVAIVHYWLVRMRGGERVLERLLRLFPTADIFTHVYDPEGVSELIRSRTVRTSFIQRLPRAKQLYQSYLPLMPRALEELDLRGYDLVISSESGPAKGVIAPSRALHLCYCHSPMRYLWDHYHDYRSQRGLVWRTAMSALTPSLRAWDYASAQRVDSILANSSFVAGRIQRAWARDASVLHPPVPVELYRPADEVGPHFLWVGQMIGYKRPDIAVEAFTKLGLPLLMVGDGDMLPALRKRAGANIRFVQSLPFPELRRAYAEARALVFTAEEDFGIVPVEANAAGRPVIAYGQGGVRDSLVPGSTALFFGLQTTDALIDAVAQFERWEPGFDPAAAIANARRFAPEAFDRGILAEIERLRPDLVAGAARAPLAA